MCVCTCMQSDSWLLLVSSVQDHARSAVEKGCISGKPTGLSVSVLLQSVAKITAASTTVS